MISMGNRFDNATLSAIITQVPGEEKAFDCREGAASDYGRLGMRPSWVDEISQLSVNGVKLH
ncbi:hypothetical protein NIBR502774_18190 (plasmid) [Rhizobium sp. NIBRBAC000502774]|nr:hypothetical protein NIBR502774_18190 [Rhizobium sp. NIBRBAC000502774]